MYKNTKKKIPDNVSGIITILGFASDSEQETCLYLFDIML